MKAYYLPITMALNLYYLPITTQYLTSPQIQVFVGIEEICEASFFFFF